MSLLTHVSRRVSREDSLTVRHADHLPHGAVHAGGHASDRGKVLTMAPASGAREDPVRAVRWRSPKPPRRILAIRLQAMGDVAITLPYLQSLRRLLPDTDVDLLTREEASDIPRSLALFTRVFALRGGREAKWQLAFATGLLPRLLARRYDVVLDLQRNRVSRWVRMTLRPPCWSEFDRYSPIPHGERTRLAIEAAGFCLRGVYPDLAVTCSDLALDRLGAAGWTPDREMVVLNPAGGFPSRNWPLHNYVEFARLWRSASGRSTQFVVLGLASMKAKAAFLRAQLGPCLIDLSAQTSPAEAFAMVRRATLVVSEDSGLMHMAWISGVPTVALFGSSRASWSAPQGNYSVCLHSGDLPCGACMEAECRFGDVHCLTRYEPAMVVEVALRLVTQSATMRKIIWEPSQRSPGCHGR